MSSREEQEHISHTRPQEELESPFLAEELFVEEFGDEWEARLATLEAESPFQSAFEQGQTNRIEPEELEEAFDEEGDYSAEEGEIDFARLFLPVIPEDVEVIAETEDGYTYDEASFSKFLDSPKEEYDSPPIVSRGISDATSNREWPRALELAIREGWHDENDLTNLLFLARHQELGKRKLDPTKNKEDRILSQEWIRILKREVRPAILKASVDINLKVSGFFVAERDPQFSGKKGKKFKELVEWAAREVDINPGLLAAVLLAEWDNSSLYLSSGEVSSFVIGTDDFFAQRAQLRAKVLAFSQIHFNEKRKTQDTNEHDRKVTSILFKTGKDATLATAVYLKYGEIKLRKAVQKNGRNFDKLSIETRFALVRIAMAAGHGGIAPDGKLLRFKKKGNKVVALKKGESGGFLVGVAERLSRVLKGEDILVRKDEPRKNPSKDKNVTDRNATILVAQAIHLSEWFFGIPLKTGLVQPELEAFEEFRVDDKDFLNLESVPGPETFEEFEDDFESTLNLESEPELEQVRVESVPGVDFADELEETREETYEQAGEQIDSLYDIEYERTGWEEAEGQLATTNIYNNKLDEALLNLKPWGFNAPVSTDGRYDSNYWLIKEDPKPWGGSKRKMLVLKTGKQPSIAIKEIVDKSSTKWTMDCAFFVQVVHLYALSQADPAQFDRLFMNREFWLRYHDSSGTKKKYFFRRVSKNAPWKAHYGRKWNLVSSKWNENSISNSRLMPRGSRIMWTNELGSGDFKNENTVKVGNDRYRAFGYDTNKVLSGRQIALLLAAIARNEAARNAGQPEPDPLGPIKQNPSNASSELNLYTNAHVYLKEAVSFHRP